MATKLRALWNWTGTTGRVAYVSWGLGLMTLKYFIDHAVAAFFHAHWTWLSYWAPLRALGPLDPVAERAFLMALLAVALPFIAVGVVLTLRRLRDVGWPLWMVGLFFLPALNLVLFAFLAFTPARPPQPSPPTPANAPDWSVLGRFVGISNPIGSACVALALTSLLGLALIGLGTLFFETYGWGVFVALPFCLGMFAALFHGMSQPRTWAACAGVGVLAAFFCGVALIAVALEGTLCILMAAPLAIPVVLLGATAGYFIQIARWNRLLGTTRLYAVAWFALPLAFFSEQRLAEPPPLIAVTTEVIIASPPRTVWRHVVTFSELPPPQELIFRSGIAYPVRASIQGSGIGAVRHCEFSTGPFVEPITTWDEPRRLAFDVTAQPHPMRELSPYRAIEPPHLNGFFQSRRGQFLLIAQPDGSTRLEGTTWYDQNLWPNRYWRGWSDYLVHRIHQRVLEHIKREAEADLTP
jgi:hypothetical protein